MNPLDENPKYIEPATVPVMPTITRYGMMGGLVIAGLTLIGILTGLSSPANWGMALIFSVVTLVAYVVIMVIGVKHDRDNNLGGYISFGRAFIIAFGIGAIASLIGMFVNIIYMGFINPDYMAEIAESSRGMYESLGMPEDDIDKAIEQASGGIGLSGLLLSQFFTYLFGAVVGAIISLIVAATTKKDAPRLV